MTDVFIRLQRLQRNPFFRTVGRFKGFNQESLILHKEQLDIVKSIAHGICSDVDIRFMMECSVSKQRT